jgi:hypothetical protein
MATLIKAERWVGNNITEVKNNIVSSTSSENHYYANYSYTTTEPTNRQDNQSNYIIGWDTGQR